MGKCDPKKTTYSNPNLCRLFPGCISLQFKSWSHKALFPLHLQGYGLKQRYNQNHWELKNFWGKLPLTLCPYWVPLRWLTTPSSWCSTSTLAWVGKPGRLLWSAWPGEEHIGISLLSVGTLRSDHGPALYKSISKKDLYLHISCITYIFCLSCHVIVFFFIYLSR